MDRLRELEAEQDEIKERLAHLPADLPDIHLNVAGTCSTDMSVSVVVQARGQPIDSRPGSSLGSAGGR